MRGVLITAIAVPLLCSSLGLAQTPDTATLRGHVEDQTRSGIEGASITLTNALTGMSRTTETDKTGDFYIGGLTVDGAYSVIAEKDGFTAAQADHLSLAGDITADITVILGIAGAHATVSVTGTAESLRADQPQTGILLTAEQIADTPLYGNKITYLPLLSAANRPAISQGDIFMNQDLFNTNGAGRRQTWFEIDGTNANDSWGRQTIFTNIPVAAIQEMSVLTSAFSAEYGGSTGSVVNLVTQSGGNHYHGDLFELWRPAAAEASLYGFNSQNASSGNDIASDTLGQSSASIGGPLGHSRKMHFFTAGEYNRQNRVAPVVTAFYTGPFDGHYRNWIGDLRLDRDFTPGNNAFIRANADGFYDTNPNGIVGGASLPSVARIFRKKTYAIGFGDTAVLSATMVNNLRLQFQLASPITEFDPVVYGTQFVVPIAGNGTYTSGTSQSALLMNRQHEISEVLAIERGKHQLRVGGSSLWSHTGGNSKEFGGPIYLGKFTYNSCTNTIAYCESPTYLGNIANVANYQQSYGNAAYTVNDALWAVFAQDDYHINNNLTLNLGIRYEQQTFTDFRMGFAPRVGFAYKMPDVSGLVVRGGFGIYDGEIVDNSQANYALTGPTGVFNYTATPGQAGFPASITAVPLPSLPTGAVPPLRSLYIRPGRASYYNQFFPTSTLLGYPGRLVNPYSEQWTLGIEHQLSTNWILMLDYVGNHTIRINRPLDVDPPTSFIRTAQNQIRSAAAANCTRPYWVYYYSQEKLTCSSTSPASTQPPYSVIQSDVNDGYSFYHALDINLRHTFSRGSSLLASYTWSHATDNVDPDIPGQNPNDPRFTGREEYGPAIFDQRNRFVLSGGYMAPFKFRIGGVATMASGLPYNIVTGDTNSGDTGATTDRPIVNGVVLGRNAGRGGNIYDIAPFAARAFPLMHERILVDLRAEAFNVTNHANFVGYNGTYGEGATPPPALGSPAIGVTNQLPARSLQFSAKLTF